MEQCKENYADNVRQNKPTVKTGRWLISALNALEIELFARFFLTDHKWGI
jgi:hypothetical protein